LGREPLLFVLGELELCELGDVLDPSAVHRGLNVARRVVRARSSRCDPKGARGAARLQETGAPASATGSGAGSDGVGSDGVGSDGGGSGSGGAPASSQDGAGGSSYSGGGPPGNLGDGQARSAAPHAAAATKTRTFFTGVEL